MAPPLLSTKPLAVFAPSKSSSQPTSPQFPRSLNSKKAKLSSQLPSLQGNPNNGTPPPPSHYRRRHCRTCSNPANRALLHRQPHQTASQTRRSRSRRLRPRSFSHDAVATHLKAVGEPLIKAFGDSPPYAIFSDSLEAYGADWTPNLPAEFQKRRGYDLIPHLSEVVGGGTPAADKVRHDWGQTLTELVNENYLTQINNWAITHHTKFRSQTYGEPAVNFSSQNSCRTARR